MFGKTAKQKQRFKCLQCNKTFVRKRKDRKISNEQHWFKLWVTEGYSMRQLSAISGHSEFKLKQIKNYWLNQDPPALLKENIIQSKYLLIDGTYFHKKGCLVVFVDIEQKQLIHFEYIKCESFNTVYPILLYLKEQGLNPSAFTLDGHRTVTSALLKAWPNIVLQRCLFHIKNQSLMWIRHRPKSEAGLHLKELVCSITQIKTVKDRDLFITSFQKWNETHKKFIQTAPKNSAALRELKRTTGSIRNALPNMFHFINDPKIVRTTNYLEGFYSQLKHHYRGHRGLTETHKVQYLKWYCYLRNKA